MRVTRESNRRSLKGSRGVVTHPRNAPASFLESQRHAELDSSLQPRIALAQVVSIPTKRVRFTDRLSLAADIFEMRCANHCSKLAANCSERWVGVEALQSGLLIPPRFVAQSRLLNRATSIPGLTTGAITELLATEALALLVKG